MGDLAEAIIEGEACQMCGIPIEHGDGVPTYCSTRCAHDHGADPEEIRRLKRVLREIGDLE